MEQGTKGFYKKIEKNEQQQKAANKKARKEANKKKREAERLAEQEKALELARAEMEKEKLREQEKQREAKRKEEETEKVRREERDKARKEKPAKFPESFDDGQARMIILDADFSQPDYVETGPSKAGTMTRRAFVHYVKTMDFGDDDPWHYDCWIGANAHPPKESAPGVWTAGNSYILEYPGFAITTSPTNVAIIKNLPASLGEKPDVLL